MTFSVTSQQYALMSGHRREIQGFKCNTHYCEQLKCWSASVNLMICFFFHWRYPGNVVPDMNTALLTLSFKPLCPSGFSNWKQRSNLWSEISQVHQELSCARQGCKPDEACNVNLQHSEEGFSVSLSTSNCSSCVVVHEANGCSRLS